jgi:hypothetical protein
MLGFSWFEKLTGGSVARIVSIQPSSIPVAFSPSLLQSKKEQEHDVSVMRFSESAIYIQRSDWVHMHRDGNRGN